MIAALDPTVLEGLIAKATQEDLTDDGRYFADSFADLTKCHHQEIGEYQHRADGKLIEWLWNQRHSIADCLRSAASAPGVPGDVHALVIAARIFWDARNDTSSESRDLDKALEAFASRVPYEGEPAISDAPVDEAAAAASDGCTACGAPLARGYMACDETMGHYCASCWEAVRCDQKHGEGCATAVWIAPGESQG
ncbi:hypothetical protein [Sphingomonas oligoaromativorans]|uniref:hypothetical protein n=1 Tax=Sphingomonas oligoaromativorans TaxID=575322 RepID=UPI0014218B92|nr:hypothetical protein [Sphingomonas oligoaromativorans]NIJ34305.1 hypothetical protein [Sphingomonas oligoaromativorans]